MPDDTDSRPLDQGAAARAEGAGAAAISAGAGAVVRVDNRVGVAIGGQAGDVSIGTVVVGDQVIQLPPTGLAALRQLRAPAGDFVGREPEIAALVAALSGDGAAGVGGITGMGGIGKTELAMVVGARLAGRFPDAQIVLGLQGSREPALSAEEAMRRVIRAFHPDARLPDERAELDGLYRSVLAGRRVLILADDARDAAQVRPLLPPPGSALLVTSRQRFELPGMRRLDLERLGEGEAAALLLAVCGRLGAAEARQIAAACGRLPLALRVAGGLLAGDGALAAGDYLGRLADERRRLAALRHPDDPELDVEASLALSYALLGAGERAALAALGVFAASFDAAAAGALLGEADAEALAARLGLLARRSLLEHAPAGRRYELHELVRAFALARLGDDEPAARLRHARHYIAVAEQAQRLYLAGGAGVAAGLALFDAERPNLDAARRWLHGAAGDAECDALLVAEAGATAEIAGLRYHPRGERIPQLEAALAAARRLGRRDAEGRSLGNLGLGYYALGDYPQAIEHHEQHLVIARELGDRRGEGNALGGLGRAHEAQGEYQRAIEHHEQSLAIARALGDRRGEGNALGGLGLAYRALGEYQRAIECYQQRLAIARDMGDRRSEGIALGNLGNMHEAQGEYQRAIEHHERHLTIARELGDRRGEGNAIGNLGGVHEALGDYPRAIEHQQQRLAIARAIGDRSGEGAGLGNLGNTYRSLGDYRRAIEHYEQSLAIARAIGDRGVELTALGNLGNAYYSLSDYPGAIEYHQQALALARAIGHRRGEGTALGNLGNLYYSFSDYSRAIEHHQEHRTISRELGDRQGEANASWNLGNTFIAQGDLAGALPHFEAGMAFFQAIGHPNAERMAQQIVDLRLALLGQGGAAVAGAAADPGEDEAGQARELRRLVEEIVAVARGDNRPRVRVEHALNRMARDGWRLSGPVGWIWEGERDAARLTAGLDERSAQLVREALAVLAGPAPRQTAGGSLWAWLRGLFGG